MFNKLTDLLESNDYEVFQDNSLLVTKWDWEYEQALYFQKQAVELLKEYPKLQVFIFCSHPHCFTNGRGLQKRAGKVLPGLIEFDKKIIEQLPYPYHEISRGGGLTFHYPGQWIFYPIVNLTAKKFTLPVLMNWILETLQKTLNEYSEDSIEIKLQEKAGLWRKERKLASLGFALERFITFHGLAFNLFHDQAMFEVLQNLNPCGLNSDIYQAFQDKIIILNRDKLQVSFQTSLKKLISN